jgi:hypothetical protein
LYEAEIAADDLARILKFIEKQVAGGRNDMIHDLLPFLGERMTVFNKAKQIGAREFLTDQLIDQIVYRLYEVTQDEIQIVEESTKP